MCVLCAQEEAKAGELHNRGNAFLNYEDNWYILAYARDKYALIYYIGNNDAWKGYGGATVYTRCARANTLCRPRPVEAHLTCCLWTD